MLVLNVEVSISLSIRTESIKYFIALQLEYSMRSEESERAVESCEVCRSKKCMECLQILSRVEKDSTR